MNDLKALLCAIQSLPQDRQLIVALDGRCASGKTTLASRLQEETGCSVIHMDHFFLRPDQRLPARLNEPGENVDHERFLREVMLPLKKGLPFSYRPWVCHAQNFGEPIVVPTSCLTVVEGSYSCHPSLWEYYDLRVFLTVGADEQLKRIEARGGQTALAAFRAKWIPLEEKYFSAFDLPARCDLVIDTSAE